MESLESKKGDFFINLGDIGFQKCEGIFDFWIDILSVGYEETIGSIFRIEKMSNRLEFDILFHSFAIEFRKNEQEN